MGCWPHKWWLNTLCHNAILQSPFTWVISVPLASCEVGIRLPCFSRWKWDQAGRGTKVSRGPRKGQACELNVFSTWCPEDMDILSPVWLQVWHYCCYYSRTRPGVGLSLGFPPKSCSSVHFCLRDRECVVADIIIVEVIIAKTTNIYLHVRCLSGFLILSWYLLMYYSQLL